MDIRRYFSGSPRSVTTKQPDTDKKKKKTKKIILSDSESDDEVVVLKSKKVSTSEQSTAAKKDSEKKKKTEQKSHYFENLKPVNPKDVFGSSSIKRSGVPIKKNKETKDSIKNRFQDDEFDATFLQLDDKSVELLMGEKKLSDSTSKSDLSSSNSNLDNRTGDKNSPKRKKEISSTINGASPVKKVKVIPSESSKNNLKSNKDKSISECLVLSESSDSDIEIDRKPLKKALVNEASCSPEKKPSKSPEKKVSNEKKRNECMDLSESDSDEQGSLINTKKIEDDITKPPRFSPKEKKDVFNNDFKSGQKRKCNDDEGFKNQKKPKTTNINEDRSPQKSNNVTPKVTIVSNLWVDKYKPTNLKQVIGQQGDKSNVKKLLNWLQNWKKSQSGKTKLYRPSPWAKDDDGSYFKAALLSGPPGVGKTTTAHLVCKEIGFDVVEFNASDTRSKKSLQQEVSELLSTKSLAPYFYGINDQEVTSNHVLLMDEVDGMAGNEDRGGIQELIQLIKSSRVPVICMCNDRNHPKMRSLVNYCYDLRFNRPRVEQIKGAMMSVCFKEGLKITPDQLNDIIKSTNQDIRLVLNHLSVLAAQKESKLANSEKYVRLGPWDVLRKVFSEEELKKMSFYDKSDLFFYDYSIAPLFVQENYLNVVPHAKLNKIEKMKVFAKTAESICTGDIVEKTIRTSNAWSLLPVEAIFASVVPGELLKGHVGGQINFPSWLGKNSTKNKMDRLQQELLIHTRLKASGSKEAINLDYSSHLRDLIVRPLLENGSDGVQDALNALQSYDLLKEDLESLTEVCKWPNKKDPMDKVESKVKAAFTRAYNKSSILSPYAVTATIKKGRGAGAGVDSGDLLSGENDEDGLLEDVEEDADSIDVDAMITTKKKTSKKQQELPSTSKEKGTGKRRGRGGKK